MSCQTLIFLWSDASTWVLLNDASKISIIFFWNIFPLSSCSWVNFLYWHIHFSLSTRYETLSDVVFLSIICFPIGFIVNIFWVHHYSTRIVFNCLYIYKNFNGRLELIFTKRNTGLNFITNILSSPKISPKYIQIFYYFFIWCILDMLENYWKKRSRILSGGLFWYKP